MFDNGGKYVKMAIAVGNTTTPVVGQIARLIGWHSP
jgi:hypothetical protein